MPQTFNLPPSLKRSCEDSRPRLSVERSSTVSAPLPNPPSNRKRRSLRRLGRVLQVNIDCFIPRNGGHMRIHLPVKISGKQLPGLHQKLFEISSVIDLARANLPCGPQSGRQTIIDPAKLKLAHAVDRTFVDRQPKSYACGSIIELGFHLDAGENVSPRTIKLADAF